VDQQLKQLMKELGEAINESLSDSESIAEVVSRIKEGGLRHLPRSRSNHRRQQTGRKHDDNTPGLRTLAQHQCRAQISDQDLKFLKSLRIKLDHEEEE